MSRTPMQMDIVENLVEKYKLENYGPYWWLPKMLQSATHAKAEARKLLASATITTP
jgi:hypothetical protein